MTLPSYVASSNANSTAGTTASTRAINRPAAWVSGLLAVAAIWRGTNEAFTALPSGWTETSGSPFRLGTTADYVSVFWKTLGGSEPSSYTWTWTTSVYCEIVALAILDADPTTPINQAAGQSNASSTTITCPAVTPTVTVTLLLCIGGYDNDTSYTSNTGMTERLDFGGWAITMATETGPNCVTSGTNTFTAAGGAFENVGITLAIQEAGATGCGGGGGSTQPPRTMHITRMRAA